MTFKINYKIQMCPSHQWRNAYSYFPTMVCWGRLILAQKNQSCTSLSNSTFSDFTMIAWNWSLCIYTIKISKHCKSGICSFVFVAVFRNLVAKYLPVHRGFLLFRKKNINVLPNRNSSYVIFDKSLNCSKSLCLLIFEMKMIITAS